MDKTLSLAINKIAKRVNAVMMKCADLGCALLILRSFELKACQLHSKENFHPGNPIPREFTQCT